MMRLLIINVPWSFDILGEVSKAVPFYEKAIKQGLSGKDIEGAILGLGSTYRTIINRK